MLKNMMMTAAAGALLCGASLVTPALADQHEAPIKALVEAKLKAALNDPIVIAAIKAQNEKNAAIAQADIDALDKQWRGEVDAGGGALVDATLASELSSYLKKVKDDQQGALTELFVMDAKGLNVGQSDPTSDYWQGDEAKWQKTFSAGADAVFVDEVEQDESTQQLQSQASFTISDPETGEPIGAATAGINLEML